MESDLGQTKKERANLPEITETSVHFPIQASLTHVSVAFTLTCWVHVSLSNLHDHRMCTRHAQATEVYVEDKSDCD